MKETIKENHFSVSLAILSERNLKFTRVTSKNINKTTGHLDKLSAETVDLTVNLEFTHTQKKHWRGTIPGRKSNKKLKTEVKAIEDDLLNAGQISPKLIELEDRSRKITFQ